MNNISNTFNLAKDGGAVQASGGSYIKRPIDDMLFEACLESRFSYVLACRQIGKSSLMNAVADRLVAQGIHVARLQLDRIGTNDVTPEQWYQTLLRLLSKRLRLVTDINQWWKSQPNYLAPVDLFLCFIDDVLLVEIQEQIVIFIDEIDLTLKLPFSCDDFFAIIRSIYNERGHIKDYKRLTFVLLGVATPEELINDDKRTPFNIGFEVPIKDFSLEECRPFQLLLETKYPEKGYDLYRQIYSWTNGHPYLTQVLTREVLEGSIADGTTVVEETVAKLFLNAERPNGNISFVQMRVLRDDHCRQMLTVYRSILADQKITDDKKSPAINRLKLYGLIISENGILRVHNKIYYEVFNLAWCRENNPPDQYQKVAILSIIIAVIAVLFAGFILWNSYVRVPSLASAIETKFLQNTEPQQQFKQLIDLIELDNQIPLVPSTTNYGDKAIELFFRLPAEQQMAIFEEPQVESQVLIQQLYTTLGDVHLLDSEDKFNRTEDLLTQMAMSIVYNDTNKENAKLKEEITDWLQARQFVRIGDHIDALSYYSRALEKNKNNPSTLYERALIRLKLEQYQAALEDLEQVARVINLLSPEGLLTALDSEVVSATISVTSTVIPSSTLTLPQNEVSVTPSLVTIAPQVQLTSSPTFAAQPNLIAEETISTTTKTLRDSIITPESWAPLPIVMTPTYVPLVFRRVSPTDFVIALRLLFTQYPQLLMETDATPSSYPNLSTLDLMPSIREFQVGHFAYQNRAQTLETISYQDDPQLDNSEGITPLEARLEITRSFNYKLDVQLNNGLTASQALKAEIFQLYRLSLNDLETDNQISRCSIENVIQAGRRVDILLPWVEKWAEGTIYATTNDPVKKQGTFSIFLGYEPCKPIFREYESPERLEFAVKHLNDKVGEQVTEVLSYTNEPELDNRKGSLPLQVQIQFERNYRYQIIENLNTTEILEGNVSDKIGELYKLPANNTEESLQTAICPVSIVIPAGQKTTITVQWTERWAEGVINKGLDGSGDRLGSYEVFLGYTEPCSLIDQENTGSTIETPTPVATTSTQSDCTMLITCIIINKGLPYVELPEITIALQAGLTASPSHPTSQLPIDPIPAGAKVELIATDSNVAWLLVAHQNKLGWLPAFFSQTGTGRLEPPIVIKPLDGTCTQYLDATSAPDEAWISKVAGSIIVEGSIFRPVAQASFTQASLQMKVTGGGQIVASDYLHLPLTPSSSIILFAFDVQKVTQGSKVQFLLDNADTEALSFQTSFFSNECPGEEFSLNSEFVDRLPIGKPKPNVTE